jgi:transcriptional regulator with XRE-family HTH domain
MSQEAVARVVGVTMRAYQAWERDEAKRIQYANLVRLAEVLGATPEYIEHGPPRDSRDLLLLILDSLGGIERLLVERLGT